MINLELHDNEFEKRNILETRNIVRALVLDADGKVYILKIKRNDIFGNCEYFETPGGGIEKGENEVEALKRELDEELGLEVEPIVKLGIIKDEYNLINRQNINNYYLCRATKKTRIHHESLGDEMISEIFKVDIKELINLYQVNKESNIGRLVFNREVPIIKETIEYFSNKK